MTQAQDAFATAASLGLKDNNKKVLNEVLRGVKEDIDTNASGISSINSDLNDYTAAFSVSGANVTFSGAVVVSGDLSDGLGNVRVTPENAQTSGYTLVATDVGKFINTTSGGVTVPSGVFSVGDSVLIYNNSSGNQTITEDSGITLRTAGTSGTGNITLAQYGVATIFCVGSGEFVGYGTGLS